MPRVYYPPSVLDRHVRQFYPGVPVHLHQNALCRPMYIRHARFWFMSNVSVYRAWVIVWAGADVTPTVYLVDISRMTISHNPQDPPEMPEWANKNHHGLRWLVEREEQRGATWLNPITAASPA